ncbi:MAG: tRNA (5-methyl aminomethyl-2-thiouridylate)-methyltransferase [Parcubacteria group bacterium Gr01-1014_13]|nr:MAG: tRNA (5-methyl aminomethyl-2-thiouridylate)-methyltransferase [Parcubacteria group bacterium Gr01-1014_13]
MSKANNKIKVLCAMSGGVDSSVAAALLVAEGYNVTGAFMVNYDEIGPNGESCWAADYQDALRVAAKLGIPLLRWDFVKEYKETVLDYMFSEYEKGRTPNPDILCNKFVKFGSWLDKAKELGFNKLATGHYARIKQSKNSVKLMEAKDKNKDQTYFLHQLNQGQLKHAIFPIGDYTKPEVRKLAKKFGLPNADKEESMGICFVGEVPMKDFLLKKIKSKPGKILLSTGEVIGEHDGLPFYTIGQRNLGVKTKENKPLYVLDKNFEKNELVVGYEDDVLLYKKEAEVDEINWISGKPKFPLSCEVRLRHRQTLEKVKVEMKNKKIFLKFSKPQRAVTPGQFAVFYKKGECLGGGVIS